MSNQINKIKGVAWVLLALALGCNKSIKMPGAASLTIVNATNSSSALVTNFEPSIDGKTTPALQYYSSAAQINNNGFAEFGSYYGTVNLTLSQLSDTTAEVWTGVLSLPIGSIQSFFLSGDTSHVDTLLTTDVIPYYPPTDSVAGLRFVNLSKGSLPMTVNITGNPGTQTEFSNLGYQQLSAFKGYPATAGVGTSYNFDIRDQATDSVLATYTWNFALQKSMTLVIAGSATAGFSVFGVNDY